MATQTIERLDGERASLVAWLERRFRGRLTPEDAEDLVAEALPRLADDAQLPLEPRQAESYIRRALFRDALDELRHRHGRDMQRWELGLEDALEERAPGAEPEQDLAEHQERLAAQAAAARVLERLRRNDAEVLRRRFLDDASPEAIAAELRISRSQYKRRLASASRRALDALVDAHSGDACPGIRRLIQESPTSLLARDQAERRDAHLDECVHCRAFSLRARGALELLPLPAIGVLDRLGLRFGGLLGRGGESMDALRDGSDLAAGGGAGLAGAGTALGAGLGAKVAIGCTGAAVAVMCAGPLGVVPRSEPASVKHVAAKTSRARASKPEAPAVAPTVTVATSVAPSGTRAAGQTGARQRSTRPTPRVVKRPSAAREFGPESSVPATTAPSASTASRGGEFEPAPPPPPRTAPAATQPSSSSFAEEFSP